MSALVDQSKYAEAVSATRSDGREPKLEKTLAEVVLEQAARSADTERRRRAFAELALAGTRGKPVLQRLLGATQPWTRALAWTAAMQLGDDDARENLRRLANDADPELSALGYAALDPSRDRQQLITALTLPNRARRAAAVRVLQASPASPDVRVALEAVALHDPEPSVRASALTALARQGPGTAPAIERALTDGEESVRIAATTAVAVLVREGCEAEPAASSGPDACDRDRLLARLGHDLGGAPTHVTLTAAAAMLRVPNAPEPERARDLFDRALSSGDVKLRAISAVLCRGQTPPGCGAALLRERLRVESVLEVKLLVALALGPRDPLARAALEAMMRGPTSETAVEAAAELAAIGDGVAQQTLGIALQAPEPRVRISALRALARSEASGAVSNAARSVTGERVVDRLADRDERVRIAAAAAVLAAS
jgi:hypothetical protein